MALCRLFSLEGTHWVWQRVFSEQLSIDPYQGHQFTGQHVQAVKQWISEDQSTACLHKA